MGGLFEVLTYAGIGMVIAAVFMFLICREEREDHHE